MRTINILTLTTLKKWEGLSGGKPALVAYKDSVGVATIGFGHTKGVAMGLTCTPEQAQVWLNEDLTPAATAVERNVVTTLNDNEFGALVMFVFNVGIGAFLSSTLLKVLNAGMRQEVPDQLMRWNKGTVNGKMVEIAGLTNRRNAEIKLWQTTAA